MQIGAGSAWKCPGSGCLCWKKPGKGIERPNCFEPPSVRGWALRLCNLVKKFLSLQTHKLVSVQALFRITLLTQLKTENFSFRVIVCEILVTELELFLVSSADVHQVFRCDNHLSILDMLDTNPADRKGLCGWLSKTRFHDCSAAIKIQQVSNSIGVFEVSIHVLARGSENLRRATD